MSFHIYLGSQDLLRLGLWRMSYDILSVFFLYICFNVFSILQGLNETCCGKPQTFISIVGIMLHQDVSQTNPILYFLEWCSCLLISHCKDHYSSTCSLQRGDGPSSVSFLTLSVINLRQRVKQWHRNPRRAHINKVATSVSLRM